MVGGYVLSRYQRRGTTSLTLHSAFNSGAVVTADLLVGGVATGVYNNYYGTGAIMRIIAMRHFTASDSVEVRLWPVANRTLQVVAYGSANESPHLHIVRIA